jgi:hypothetical protein
MISTRAVAVLAMLVGASANAVTPVQKVVQLLNGMVEKGKKDKHDEQVQFASYKQFCDDTTVEKNRDIKESNQMIEVLKADIEKYEADAARMAREIAAHDDDITTWEGDFKAANKVREIEHEDYVTTHKDYTESLDALEEGIATVKKQGGDVKQSAASLMQISALDLIPAESKKALDSVLAQEEGTQSEAAPEASAYEFQGQAILDMLTKLEGKFYDERTALEKAEVSNRQSFEVLSQDLKADIGAATQARTEKTQAKAKALQNSADAKGDLQDTTETRDDDVKYLAELTAACSRSQVTLPIDSS